MPPASPSLLPSSDLGSHGWRRLGGPLFYLLLFLVVVWLAYGIQTTHSARWRGVVRGLPAEVPLASIPPWGTTVALEQYTDDAALDAALDEMAALGLVWLRQRLPWEAIEPRRGSNDWAPWDRVIRRAAARGFRLVLVLDGSPAWARAPEDRAEPLAPPADPADFARFAAAVAARYGDQVDFYQVWDEPNLRPHWGAERFVDPAGYAALLAPAAAAIRASDDGALILTAGLAPNGEEGGYNMSEWRFLQGLYAAGAAGSFDVVALKGFGFWTGPDDRRLAEDVLNWSRPIAVREVMEAAGDGATAIWLTGGGWAALPADWQGAAPPWGSDAPATQAARLRDGLARAQREWPWMGALLVQEFQPPVPRDDPRWGLALRAPDGSRTPLGETVAAAAATWLPGPGWWLLDGAEAWRFQGSTVALAVAQLSTATVTAQVDGDPAPLGTLIPDAPVVLARGLPFAPHTLTVAGSPAGTRAVVGYEASFAAHGVMLGVLALLALSLGGRLAWLTWQLPWQHFRADLLGLPERAQVALVVGVVAAFALVPNLWLSLALAGLLWLLFVARLDLGLAAVAFAIPFFLLPKAFGGLRFSLVELLVLLCAAAWLWRVGEAVVVALRRRRLDLLHATLSSALWPRDALDWSVLLFALYAGLSVLWAFHFGVAAREWRVVIFEPVLFYWLVRRLDNLDLPPGRDAAMPLLRLLDALVAAGVLLSLYGLYQWLFTGDIITAEGVRRVRGVYASPNNLSLFLDRIVPLLVAVALLWRSRTGEAGARPHLYALALLPVSAALFLTFSRGAWLLGVPGSLLFIAWRCPGWPRRLVLGGLALGLLALLPFAATERIRSTVDVGSGTWFVRLKLWEATLAMLADRWTWLRGIGLDNFLYLYQDYRLPEAWREPDLSHPHNLILHPWVALGLLGLLSMGTQQWAFWQAAVRLHRAPLSPLLAAVGLGLAASMVAALAHGLIDNSYFLVDLAFIYMLTLGLVGLLAPPGAGEKQEEPDD